MQCGQRIKEPVQVLYGHRRQFQDSCRYTACYIHHSESCLTFIYLEEMITGLVKGVKTGGRKEYDTVVELYGKPKTPTEKIAAMSVHLDLS